MEPAAPLEPPGRKSGQKSGLTPAAASSRVWGGSQSWSRAQFVLTSTARVSPAFGARRSIGIAASVLAEALQLRLDDDVEPGQARPTGDPDAGGITGHELVLCREGYTPAGQP